MFLDVYNSDYDRGMISASHAPNRNIPAAVKCPYLPGCGQRMVF